jgi:hypothetical protein
MGAFLFFVLSCIATIKLLLRTLVRLVILFNLFRPQRTTEDPDSYRESFTEILCGSPFNSVVLCGQIRISQQLVDETDTSCGNIYRY